MRAKEDVVTLEGAFLVERAVSAALDITEIACVKAREEWVHDQCAKAGPGRTMPAIRVLGEREMASIAGYPFHRGVLALARRPVETSAAELVERFAREAARGGGQGNRSSTTLLALPELRDPENLGSIFRSAAALGCDALLLGPGGPDPLSRRVLRVGMGASLSLPWARLDGPRDLESFARLGFGIAACVLGPDAQDVRLYARPQRLVLTLGDEAFGLSEEWRGLCDCEVTLPMLGGTDSLNVAVAAALFSYIVNS
ncbi:MAG: TrmH family RNA methyltransferase [Rectinemataceae bacterium]